MPEYKYCIEFLFPHGVIPRSIPLPNVVRKQNSLLFYLVTKPAEEDIARIVKTIDSETINPAKRITDQTGGLTFKCYEKILDKWHDVI